MHAHAHTNVQTHACTHACAFTLETHAHLNTATPLHRDTDIESLHVSQVAHYPLDGGAEEQGND